ncbi:para-aminobenzoate synthetase component 1 [Sinobacterium caligoides]|uniref:aminodeoxychorismate synthase n=1 Tax=Sinobacterium caligoides TaxID=933926 RepID=A0A3N2DXP1_9GAMM|nr:aminodeoxychorismate synthase component I [Sinobacterium caligoides]ROS04603.1 para-aminobenzoate synthetase component 1 [Sinobacterium caligoides]
MINSDIVLLESIVYQSDSNQLFAPIHQLKDAVLLDSSHYPSESRCTDIISAFPATSIRYDGSQLAINNQLTKATINEVLSRLQQELKTLPKISGNDYRHLPFLGGLILQSSYELGLQLAGIEANPSPDGLAELSAGIYHWAIINDHVRQQTTIVTVSEQGRAAAERYKRLYQQYTAKNGADSPKFTLSKPFTASTQKEQYFADFEVIKDYIASGDCYQVNYSQHFSAPYQGDSWDAYKALKRALPSPFSAFYNTGQHQVLSISPERFIEVRDGNIRTKPIKGTRPRGKTPQADRALADELQNSSKDRAENLMIVDLLRNDLGMSAKPGSIKVPKLFALESFANVHHLVSTVSAELADDSTELELLAKAFPGGSITGAPKKRAMEIIYELENVGRSAYCGSIAYISCHGQADSSIAIRTVVADGKNLHCWGGGGIVMDSECEDEYQESITKVRLIMQTLEKLG